MRFAVRAFPARELLGSRRAGVALFDTVFAQESRSRELHSLPPHRGSDVCFLIARVTLDEAQPG